ncbi:MAG TPA: benzoate/H(+) symporter BenE family transporter [Legionellaceae bacterium]|nr:benzoate/H(+) symporter BenE family transporter [Legionellaceae bacterium]
MVGQCLLRLLIQENVLFKFSFSNVTAGFVAVLVGFTSSGVIVFQAASNAGANPAEISSWLFALGLSIALTSIGFSFYYRMPILTGWSTPGAALLVTSLTGISMSEAIGAFVFAALLTILSGVTGIFQKVMDHIPRALTSAMLAGILLHFGINVFTAMQDQASMVCAMLMIYLIGKRFFPRYVIILVLLVGILVASIQGLFHIDQCHFALSTPIFITPVFSLPALISVGIPLFVVTMTTQNIPGIAVLNNSGYQPPISPIIGLTGLATLLFAPFGCYSISLAAITAAICTDKEADPNPSQRFKASIFAGIFWLGIATFGATVVAIFFAFPNELILSIAGLALFSTIGSSVNVALSHEQHREASIITILVSASGLSLFGVGAAFWGLVAGIIATLLLNWNKTESIEVTKPA